MIRRWLNVCAIISLPLFTGLAVWSAAGRVLPGGCGTSWAGEEILYFLDMGRDGFLRFTFGTEFEPGKRFNYPVNFANAGTRALTDQRLEAPTRLPAVFVGRSHRTDVPWRSGRVEYYWVRVHQSYLLVATGAPLALWLAVRQFGRQRGHSPG